ncbi:hypothetical protein SynBIOSU31_00965 [Synechococcus sp. BIOS-U3-1]|nr:hypothetical protein SynBIOSU31_00965 [Synechococcus sp. BIOS-U3-1]
MRRPKHQPPQPINQQISGFVLGSDVAMKTSAELQTTASLQRAIRLNTRRSKNKLEKVEKISI